MDNFNELKIWVSNLLESRDDSTMKVICAITLLIVMLCNEIYNWFNRTNVVTAMSDTNYFYSHYKMIKDSIFFELDEGLLQLPSSTPPLVTPWRSINNLETILWRLSLHPNVTGRFLEIEVQAKTDNTKMQIDADIVFIKAPKPCAIHDGKLVIRADGKFTVTSQVATVSPSLPEAPERITLQDLSSTHGPFDAVLHVQNRNIDIHRRYFSMLSEVFHAMFELDTKEKKSGIVTIEDFDYKMVKTAVEYLYGRRSERLSVDEVTGVYRFADKYRMESVITKMEIWLSRNIDATNFCTIVSKTWSFASTAFRTVCGRICYCNLAQLALRDEFLQLPEADIIEILKEAAKYR